ncbi:MerR family transcriptional regulator [Rhodococcus antarcticus]|uniref:MerR family transcriptional regulator n=1 Tax=Rhodococcus antarcticus TaxID=2987751 RepID=A0ABY6P0D1_9NOCA|nr:MerR family transcriptional regulator [Rhodococcus antarcticus]UZJ24934.1 MerR family transcriptional regulator [Rhodococcus antarcticus]
MSALRAPDDTPGTGAPGAGAPGFEATAVEGLRLSVAAVARRLGVAPATLRTWDRRYGVGPSEHRPGSHRRYAPLDMRRLELMQDALAHGASPAEAARLALAALAGETTPEPPGPRAAAPGPLVVDHDTTVSTGHRSSLPMRGAGRRAHGLARAVLALDGDSTTRQLRDSIEATGVITTWDDVARPVLRALAERWSRTGAGIELEHLLTEAITTVMAQVTMSAPPPVSARPILLGSMSGELHALPLRVLRATLAERGVQTSLLGADLPIGALAAAVARTAPAALFLWSQDDRNADPDLVGQLPRIRPRTRCYVGGPGWNPTRLPPTVVALGSLGEASNVLTAAAGL